MSSSAWRAGATRRRAELIQGLLLEEGVPSILRRSAGFDVPGFLAAGPRDVMVPRAGEEAARECCQADLAPRMACSPARIRSSSWLRSSRVAGSTALVAWVLLGLG